MISVRMLNGVARPQGARIAAGRWRALLKTNSIAAIPWIRPFAWRIVVRWSEMTPQGIIAWVSRLIRWYIHLCIVYLISYEYVVFYICTKPKLVVRAKHVAKTCAKPLAIGAGLVVLAALIGDTGVVYIMVYEYIYIYAYIYI